MHSKGSRKAALSNSCTMNYYFCPFLLFFLRALRKGSHVLWLPQPSKKRLYLSLGTYLNCDETNVFSWPAHGVQSQLSGHFAVFLPLAALWWRAPSFSLHHYQFLGQFCGQLQPMLDFPVATAIVDNARVFLWFLQNLRTHNLGKPLPIIQWQEVDSSSSGTLYEELAFFLVSEVTLLNS